MIKKISPSLAGLLQSLGLLGYISLVASVIWQVDRWPGQNHPFLGPVFVLTLFVLSALICALITFAYPYRLWHQKKASQALKTVLFTTLWFSLLFVILFLSLLLFS